MIDINQGRLGFINKMKSRKMYSYAKRTQKTLMGMMNHRPMSSLPRSPMNRSSSISSSRLIITFHLLNNRGPCLLDSPHQTLDSLLRRGDISNTPEELPITSLCIITTRRGIIHHEPLVDDSPGDQFRDFTVLLTSLDLIRHHAGSHSTPRRLSRANRRVSCPVRSRSIPADTAGGSR